MFLTVLMFMIAIIDYKKSKIPNICILTGMVYGMMYQFLHNGMEGVVFSIIQAFVLFMLFYPFYLVKGLGAGDVKLFMMLGMYFPPQELLNCLFITFLLAAGKCMFSMIRYEKTRNRLLYFMRYIRKLCITKVLDEYEWDKSGKATIVRLAIPAFISVLCIQGGVIC